MTKASPMDVIRMALEREKAAVRTYMEFANVAKDPAVRDMFLFLAGEEKKHVKILQDEIEKETLQEM